MKIQSFIFIGRSGCGKGTQADLLMRELKSIDEERDILYIQTGLEFREFITGDSFTQKRSKGIYDAGGLQPEFLTVHMWVTPLIYGFKGNQHIIFDGTPRKLHEAGVLHSCFGFYGIEKPNVINIEISHDESIKRLLARKRFDDKKEEIEKRLSWYETDVAPTIDYYRDNPNYNFIKVDGERSVEEIHKEIMEKISLN